jgi:hypothetical protein
MGCNMKTPLTGMRIIRSGANIRADPLSGSMQPFVHILLAPAKAAALLVAIQQQVGQHEFTVFVFNLAATIGIAGTGLRAGCLLDFGLHGLLFITCHVLLLQQFERLPFQSSPVLRRRNAFVGKRPFISLRIAAAALTLKIVFRRANAI